MWGHFVPDAVYEINGHDLKVQLGRGGGLGREHQTQGFVLDNGWLLSLGRGTSCRPEGRSLRRFWLSTIGTEPCLMDQCECSLTGLQHGPVPWPWLEEERERGWRRNMNVVGRETWTRLEEERERDVNTWTKCKCAPSVSESYWWVMEECLCFTGPS